MRWLLILWLWGCHSYSFGQEDTSFAEKIKVIDAVNVTAGVTKIFDKQNLYLIDFHIDSIGNYVLLKRNNLYLLSRLDYLFEMESTVLLPFKPIGLHRNCMDELYILAKDSVYKVAELDSEIDLYEGSDHLFYETYFLNCQVETTNHLVYKRLLRSNQVAAFYSVDRKSSEKRPFYYAYDSVLVRNAREWDRVLRADGINPAANGRQLDIAKILLSKPTFQRFTYYENVVSKEGYSPIFESDSSILLFNHFIDSLIIFNPETFEIEESKTISYHKIKGWQKQLLLDPETGIFHTIYLDGGALYISTLSKEDFSIVRSKRIPSDIMTKRLMVYDGYLYYDSKDSFESSFNQLQRVKL